MTQPIMSILNNLSCHRKRHSTSKIWERSALCRQSSRPL